MCIGTKLNQQSNEDQQHGQNERGGELAKARLLFLIQPSVFNRHSRRKLHVLYQLLLNLTYRRAEVASFETSCYSDHLAQILAFDFRLAFIDFDIGHLIEAKELP